MSYGDLRNRIGSRWEREVEPKPAAVPEAALSNAAGICRAALPAVVAPGGSGEAIRSQPNGIPCVLGRLVLEREAYELAASPADIGAPLPPQTLPRRQQRLPGTPVLYAMCPICGDEHRHLVRLGAMFQRNRKAHAGDGGGDVTLRSRAVSVWLLTCPHSATALAAASPTGAGAGARYLVRVPRRQIAVALAAATTKDRL